MSRNVQATQHPNWCFTYHYHDGPTTTTDEEQQLRTKSDVLEWWEHLCGVAHFAVAGWEVCPSTGRTHLQGYVQFIGKHRLSELRRYPNGDTVHWEVARGTEEENFDYCTKEGNFIIHGDEPRRVHGGMRERKRWNDALAHIKTGRLELIDPQIQITQCRNLDFLVKKYKQRPDDLDPSTRHTWIWGPTGTGKSRAAREIMADNTWYDKSQNKWWDHYEGEHYVLIDDLEKEMGKALVVHLKRWLDIYPFVGESKGGLDKHIRPQHIIITSNFHPADIWGEEEEAWLNPILRRIEITHMASLATTTVQGTNLIASSQFRTPGPPARHASFNGDGTTRAAPGAPRRIQSNVARPDSPVPWREGGTGGYSPGLARVTRVPSHIRIENNRDEVEYIRTVVDLTNE